MKYDLELLKADVLNELESIKKLETEFFKVKKSSVCRPKKYLIMTVAPLVIYCTIFITDVKIFLIPSHDFLKTILDLSPGIGIYSSA